MFFDRLFARNYPPLDWIQVEVSSYCNASCVYFPHRAFRSNWQNRFLSLQAFRNLVPAFSNTHLFYSQGWGEPFAHSQFFEMSQVAQKAGCRVGTTTNGTLTKKNFP
jgi:MoaA/NifB/PqqE/SkfB family radical SAM enzyme